MFKLGFLTIGQSPRTDLYEDFKEIFEKKEVIQAGALDDYTREEILEKFKPEEGQTTYVSRLRDGSEITFTKEKIIPLLQEKIYSIENEVDFIVILCSGEFPMLKSKKPIIFPDKLLKHFSSAIYSFERKLGVVIPLEEQVKYAFDKWKQYSKDVKVVNASPYSTSIEELENRVSELIDRDYVIMDCIGYSLKQKEAVRKVVEKPVIATRSLLKATLIELTL